MGPRGMGAMHHPVYYAAYLSPIAEHGAGVELGLVLGLVFGLRYLGSIAEHVDETHLQGLNTPTSKLDTHGTGGKPPTGESETRDVGPPSWHCGVHHQRLLQPIRRSFRVPEAKTAITRGQRAMRRRQMGDV